MLTAVTLPVVLALSGLASPKADAPAPAATQQQSNKSAQQAGTITCPLTGEEIPSCCCPVKN